MKNSKIYFQEEQHQNWLIWIILLLVNLIFTTGLIRQVGYNEQFGDKPMSDLALILTTIAVLLFSVVLSFFTKLQTFINAEGIYVRYFPFQFRYKFIDWSVIDKVYIRKYKPLVEFGGWGIRKRGLRKTAYIMKGKIGLQLELSNGKKLLIGTQHPESLESTLSKLGKIR